MSTWKKKEEHSSYLNGDVPDDFVEGGSRDEQLGGFLVLSDLAQRQHSLRWNLLNFLILSISWWKSQALFLLVSALFYLVFEKWTHNVFYKLCKK